VVLLQRIVCLDIIGATTMEQLQENLKAYGIKLDDNNENIAKEIDAIYKKYTDSTKHEAILNNGHVLLSLLL
jgi:aryl-alcohol dehydrogenase-like predicted oxidoreductase